MERQYRCACCCATTFESHRGSKWEEKWVVRELVGACCFVLCAWFFAAGSRKTRFHVFQRHSATIRPSFPPPRPKDASQFLTTFGKRSPSVITIRSFVASTGRLNETCFVPPLRARVTRTNFTKCCGR